MAEYRLFNVKMLSKSIVNFYYDNEGVILNLAKHFFLRGTILILRTQ